VIRDAVGFDEEPAMVAVGLEVTAFLEGRERLAIRLISWGSSSLWPDSGGAAFVQ
jgi:hypothetical protein